MATVFDSDTRNNVLPVGFIAECLRRGKMHFMRKQKGFSLIELLIVVAIILIIAAIAIPNLLRSRIAANEASAVGSIRTINTSEVTYASTYPNIGFATLDALGGAGGSATGAGLLDAVLASQVKSGYVAAPRDRASLHRQSAERRRHAEFVLDPSLNGGTDRAASRDRG